MGDRNGPSLPDLLLEQGNNGARASQHIAEPRGNEYGGAFSALFQQGFPQALHVHFSQPLGGAHDAGGVHRLVRGDHDETLHPVLDGQGGQMHGPLHVIDHGRARVLLHQRNMLVGGRMENHIRPVQLHAFLQLAAVADIGDGSGNGNVGI